MKKISRKGFLKIAAAAAMSGVTAGALSACNSSSSSAAASTAASGASVYTAGTYTATAKGMNDVTVTMTFSETAITEVKVGHRQRDPRAGCQLCRGLPDHADGCPER